MMKRALPLALIGMNLFVMLPSVAGAAPDESLKVVIIRHGEKPDDGDNLSCEGEHRALELPAVLFEKFGVPGHVYVPSLGLGKSTTHARMFQTVTPFAVQYNLEINSKYRKKDTAKIAGKVLDKKGTVLLVWTHSTIPKLAKALGVSDPPSWEDDDFDSIWIITYATGEASLSIDQEEIDPSPDCDF